MKDRETLLNTNGQITPEQAQQIATKYGTTADAVMNPNKIFDQLTPTEAGKQKFGITTHEQDMQDAALKNQRDVQDAKTKLDQATSNLDVQISDVQKQLDRNLQVMTAEGTWNGGLKSSGYQQGIENVQQDGQATINKLKTMLANVKSANATDVDRLTTDYSTAVTRAKKDFDLKLQDAQHNNGLALNEATTKYSANSTELGRELDDINAKYGANAAEITGKFLTNMKAVNDLTSMNIDNTKKMMDLQSAIADKRYNEYTANGGSLLINTPFSQIASEVNS